jgi:aryl-alcohol dehydrogenase-like predicted oxidoreductase
LNKIALGTVQFGLDYGIANKSGRPNIKEIKSILEYVFYQGIHLLDTAISYGESEAILGKIGVENFDIVTKLPPIPNQDHQVRKWVYTEIEKSMFRLNKSQIYAILLHRSEDLIGSNGKELYESLIELKNKGLVSKIGISIYHFSQLENILTKYRLDIVQCPFNLIDRGMESSGWFKKLKNLNIEIHSRSVFLQGLLLLNPSERLDKFSKWDSIWKILDDFSNNNLDIRTNVSLNYVLNQNLIDKVIIGVDSLYQIKKVLELSKNYKQINFELLNRMISEDLNLINPSLWSQI